MSDLTKQSSTASADATPSTTAAQEWNAVQRMLSDSERELAGCQQRCDEFGRKVSSVRSAARPKA